MSCDKHFAIANPLDLGLACVTVSLKLGRRAFRPLQTSLLRVSACHSEAAVQWYADHVERHAADIFWRALCLHFSMTRLV